MVLGEALATREAVLLRYGVLGLLIERRGYGYELVQRLAERLGPAWQLNPSTVYTALDQLEEAELIAPATPSAVAPGGDPAAVRPSRRAARVVYQATDNGAREFQAWLARPTLRANPIRSEIQLKVALASPENIPPLLASIAQEESTIMRRLHEETAGAGEEGPPGGDDGWPSAAAELVTAAATTRLQGELAWIEFVRATLQRMTAQHFTAAGRDGLPRAPIVS